MIKKIYLILIIFSISILFLSLLVTIAIPSEYFVAIELESNPTKWDLIINDNSFQSSLRPHNLKEELIKFIHENKNNYTHLDQVWIFLLTTFTFSLIGYVRENRRKI